MKVAVSIKVWVPLAIGHRPSRRTVVTPMTESVAPVATCQGHSHLILVKILQR